VSARRARTTAAAILAMLAMLAMLAFAAAAAPALAAATATAHTTTSLSGAPATVPTTTQPAAASPAVSSARAGAIGSRLALVRALERTHPHSYSQVTSPNAGQWQVAFYSRGEEFVQVIVDQGDGRVLGVYTGFQIAWTMARGYPGAFGAHLDAVWIWLPLCALFLLPFFDWRRPARMLNLDLLVLLSLSVSLAFFNHADIYASVPLAYPPLVYVLARMLWLGRRGAPRPPPMRLNIGAGKLAVLLVALIAFRVGLNVIDSNVIDVGYANVVGAQKVIDGRTIYGAFPADIARGDTYGPVAYEAYVPFVELWGFSGHWDDLPAAHAAAVFFDLLAIALLFAIGRRLRGPATGVVLAYAWAAFPFTAFALESNSNDALVAALVLATLLVAGSPPARGVFAALAGLAKFAPLALVPVLATHRLRERGARGVAVFAAAFALVAVLVSIPAIAHDSLATIYQRTIGYQADRSAPFSIWGLYGHLQLEQSLVQIAALVLAGALAVMPRRDDLIGLAASAAAILIAIQLGVTYWFYLYVPWFLGAALVVLLGIYEHGTRDARWQPERIHRRMTRERLSQLA